MKILCFILNQVFSDYRCEYKIWQMIVDPKYNQLIDAVEIDKTIFFPPYRSFEKINKSGRT
jgi:hypothetical protein